VSRIRCFVAADLPDAVRDDLLSLQRRLGGRGLEARWAGRHALHLTLKFLGEIEPERFQRVVEALSEPLGIGGPLSLRPAGLGAFPSGARARVIWVGLAGDTAALARGALALEGRLQPLGIAREDRPFRAHLTLGRARAPSGIPGAAEVLEAYQDYEGPPFRVAGFVLYESRLSPSGPTHTPRLTIPLD
jgi:2'-5' RNA ligase